jgi:restriction endonuclease S subunit
LGYAGLEAKLQSRPHPRPDNLKEDRDGTGKGKYLYLTYKKKRDRSLLPSVYVTLAAALLFAGRGLWYHDMTMIGDGVIYAAGAGIFYYVYRKILD